MKIKSVEHQSFGALKCEPSLKEVQYHIATKMGMNDTIKADTYLKKLALCKNEVTLQVFDNGRGKKLYAFIGDNFYKENWFSTPLKVLKKALKFLQKEDAKLE